MFCPIAVRTEPRPRLCDSLTSSCCNLIAKVSRYLDCLGKASSVGTVEHFKLIATWAGVIAETQNICEQNPIARSARSGIRNLEYGKRKRIQTLGTFPDLIHSRHSLRPTRDHRPHSPRGKYAVSKSNGPRSRSISRVL